LRKKVFLPFNENELEKELGSPLGEMMVFSLKSSILRLSKIVGFKVDQDLTLEYFILLQLHHSGEKFDIIYF
jgi:hypothetical protein